MKNGSTPADAETWTFKVSYYLQGGWQIDDYYFNEELTERDRGKWEKSPLLVAKPLEWAIALYGRDSDTIKNGAIVEWIPSDG